ncbi:ABC transporter permease [uncultured Imperialibacter sp.]|uniref:ABC transporter permease n=1 Tax=uncultured Imperialibacter sp. TaxID=1672639 RepID=UPI0030D8B32C|tara:strand:- start:23578 stop:26184 length:2607 start_codon:yes stop_codon:yes gene_type:complete
MNKHHPPKLPLRFFRWFCHPDYQEDIEGDLFERFDDRCLEKGQSKAKWLFTLDVIKLFRPTIIKPIGGSYRMNQFGMFKNYVKVGWRSMLRQKLYAAINVGGLALSLTAFILIFLYVRHELSFDRFYPDSKRIYRTYQQQTFNPFMGSDYFAVMPAGFAETLMSDFPEVEAATSLQAPTRIITMGEVSYLEKGISADPQFFKVFDFNFLRGDAESALLTPESIVLTESLAQKLFGTDDVMGRSLTLDGRKVQVTAIIQDPPLNSTLQFTHVWSLEADQYYLDDKAKEKWEGNAFYSFLKVKEGADAVGLQAKMPELLKQRWAYDDYPTYLIQPITEWHLQTAVNFDLGPRGNPAQLALFSMIAALILILACVNYMNLAIARSIGRAKEVGLRKVIGAHKWQLVMQFLGESVFVTFVALAVAALLLPASLPYFGQMVDRTLVFNMGDFIMLAPGLLLLVIIVGILSGSYPALFMSSLVPVKVLKGKMNASDSGIRLQKGLIIGQYAISVAMIICSLVAYAQFKFISEKELGFEKEHVFTIRSYDGNVRDSFEAIKAEWLANPKVVAVTISQNLPTNVEQSNVVSLKEEGKETDYDHTIYQLRTDENYLEVFGMELIAGRTLSPEYALDQSSKNIVVNEAACREFGWSVDEAVGKTFTSGWEGDKTIVGVIKDFHMHSMHMTIAPLLVELRENFRYISVKVKPGDLPATVVSLEETFRKYSSLPFDYEFLDDNFDKLYKADIRQGEIFGFFTVIALLIACLGLFGLAAFSTQQRAKEVGIRKVLGASVGHIVALFASRFIKMVAIGYLIALPVGWWLVDQWLQEFAYRVAVQWWMLALPGLAAVIVAFLTISSQSTRAALANPVDSLRNE